MKLNLTTFLDDFNATRWADCIIKAKASKKVDKCLILNTIQSFGFDAKENALTVCQLYKQ